MTNPSVSVVIVSRGRPECLRLCLLATSQIFYDAFEIIVVADKVGLDAVNSVGLFDKIKTACFETPNISLARNIGIGLATGEVVAFLDDDSVPEPSWLYHLAPVFEDQEVMAAGGYVLGGNGISFQSKAQIVDVHGVSKELEKTNMAPEIWTGSEKDAVKTEGTNCAFRRSFFVKEGGFDPAFEYYLDDSDLNMRIAKSGGKTAVVPFAQVHHHAAASQYRYQNRMPRSLFQVGRSLAIFLRKYCGPEEHESARAYALKSQRYKLCRKMVAGNCEPNQIDELLLSMVAGFEDGKRAEHSAAPSISAPSSKFLRFLAGDTNRRHSSWISGYRIFGRRVRNLAQKKADGSNIVSIFIFSRTALFHRVRFHPDGFWEQTGGLFGRSSRSQPLFRWNSLEKRVDEERMRLALVRYPWDIG